MKHVVYKAKKYTELYNYITAWTEAINPCNIVIKDGIATCAQFPKGTRDNLLCCTKTEQKSGCAIFNTDCKHYSKTKGCKVKSLSCKLWFCEDAWKRIFAYNKIENILGFMQALQYVNQTIRLHYIPAKSRQSKKDNFEYAKKIFK